MLVYLIIMFLAGAILLTASIAIYKGRTDLIHDYHQTKVTDKAAYGKAFGKALAVIAAAPLLSGVVCLLGSSEAIVISAVAVLFIGIGIGLCRCIAVQLKYNKGVF